VELWRVYDQSQDHPGGCAVRKVLVEDDGLSAGEWQLFQSLQEARRVLARRGLIRVPRAVQDDPTLIEVWI
jgi:hypothetical protein